MDDAVNKTLVHSDDISLIPSKTGRDPSIFALAPDIPDYVDKHDNHKQGSHKSGRNCHNG